MVFFSALFNTFLILTFSLPNSKVFNMVSIKNSHLCMVNILIYATYSQAKKSLLKVFWLMAAFDADLSLLGSLLSIYDGRQQASFEIKCR